MIGQRAHPGQMRNAPVRRRAGLQHFGRDAVDIRRWNENADPRRLHKFEMRLERPAASAGLVG